MELALAFIIVLVAGFLQGTFILPMTMAKGWKWEHVWAVFSLLGMLIFNWVLTLLFIPHIMRVYETVSTGDILGLVLFGAGWGVGAILFGLGMDKLGMALGYPIIMGLISCLGALIPLVVFAPGSLFTLKGLALLAGTALVIIGIVLCARASAKKQSNDEDGVRPIVSGGLTVGLAIALFAGVLSCLPNVGMSFGKNVTGAAEALGTSKNSSGNAVWALFFTVGFTVNFTYCLYLMVRRRNLHELFGSGALKNFGLIAMMAVMWIGSFYLYGLGAGRLGDLGPAFGWPVFIALSIIIGNLWCLWRGEWKGAPNAARATLNTGLVVFLIAVTVIAVSSAL